jgi:small-conductance mechanosensitive channel
VEVVVPSHWIVVSDGTVFLSWQPYAFLMAVLALASFVAFLMLRELSEERKREVRALMKNNATHAIVGAILFVAYYGVSREVPGLSRFKDFSGLLGIFTLLQWAYFSIKLGRLVVFVALFLGNLHVHFPVLIANIATLIIAMVVVSTFATEVFHVQVMPLFATSAVATLVLGIALQDTLGNLFAGIALQIDSPYHIGHWIEVNNGGTVTVGQVTEISWRATVLKSFTDELITIPNRTISSSTISNFTVTGKPFWRGKTIRLPFGVNIERARLVMFEAIQNSAGVAQDQAPLVAVSETTESWIAFRIIYALTDYANMLTVGDTVQCNVMKALERENIPLAAARIVVSKSESSLM